MDGKSSESPRRVIGCPDRVAGAGGNCNGGGRVSTWFDLAGDSNVVLEGDVEHGSEMTEEFEITAASDAGQWLLLTRRTDSVENIGEEANFGT